jgi:anti-anti-sigma regulatory factor
MAIQNLSESVLLVTLPKEPQWADDLFTVHQAVSVEADSDVVVDFSDVEILTSESICRLMMLNTLLDSSGHQIVLCSVPPLVRSVFDRLGLTGVFAFAPDKNSALKAIQTAS